MFEWATVTGTTDYRLWLKNTTTGVIIKDQLYSTTEVGCDTGTTCSITLPSTTLSEGNYRWLIRTKNGSVWGPNSSVFTFAVTGAL